jgi:hypothetical protein
MAREDSGRGAAFSSIFSQGARPLQEMNGVVSRRAAMAPTRSDPELPPPDPVASGSALECDTGARVQPGCIGPDMRARRGCALAASPVRAGVCSEGRCVGMQRSQRAD